MFLRNTQTGDLVEVLDLSDMVDPCRVSIEGRLHAGEELQDPAEFKKTKLGFPSGEPLPRCWVDPNYRG